LLLQTFLHAYTRILEICSLEHHTPFVVEADLKTFQSEQARLRAWAALQDIRKDLECSGPGARETPRGEFGSPVTVLVAATVCSEAPDLIPELSALLPVRRGRGAVNLEDGLFQC
jgi:hypothetical protein